MTTTAKWLWTIGGLIAVTLIIIWLVKMRKKKAIETAAIQTGVPRNITSDTIQNLRTAVYPKLNKVNTQSSNSIFSNSAVSINPDFLNPGNGKWIFDHNGTKKSCPKGGHLVGPTGKNTNGDDLYNCYLDETPTQ